MGDAAFDNKTSPTAILLDSENTDQKIFSAGNALSVVATGFGTSTTSVALFFSVDFFSPITNLSVNNTFELRDMESNVIQSGLDSSNFSISIRTGTKVARLNLTGLTGIIIDKPYDVRGESGASSITISP